LATIDEGLALLTENIRALSIAQREEAQAQREAQREEAQAQREEVRNGFRQLGAALVTRQRAGSASTVSHKSKMSDVDFSMTSVRPIEADYPVPVTVVTRPPRVCHIAALLDAAREVPKMNSEKEDREACMDKFMNDAALPYGLACVADNADDNRLALDDLYDGTITTGAGDMFVTPLGSRRPLLGVNEQKPRLNSRRRPNKLTTKNCNQTMCYVESVRRRFPSDVDELPHGVPIGILSCLEEFVFYKSTGRYSYASSKPTYETFQVAAYLDDLFSACEEALRRIPADHVCRQGDAPAEHRVDDEDDGDEDNGSNDDGGRETEKEPQQRDDERSGDTPMSNTATLTRMSLKRHNVRLAEAAVRKLLSF
jgi:hypothetical protein